MKTKDNTIVVVSFLKKLRVDAGLSQEKLAESAGIHPTYVGLIERGKRIPTIAVVLSIAEALELPPCRFFQELSEFFISSKRKALS